jgi:hypothetical protein
VHLFAAFFQGGIPSDFVEKAGSLSTGEPYRLSDNILLFQSYVDNPQYLRDPLGIDASTTGVLFKLNGSYSGYFSQSLWDWLKEARPVG